MRRVFWALALAAVAGTSPATTHSAIAQVQIAVIGDSGVFGKGVSPSENYPSQLETALRARGLDVRVSNGGLNGDTTVGLAARLDSAIPPGTRIAVLWIGANDYQRGVSIPEIKANISGITKRLRAKGLETYVIAPPVYAVADHQNPALIIGGGDNHFNAAGYRRMVGRTIGPIASLVKRVAKRKTA